MGKGFMLGTVRTMWHKHDGHALRPPEVLPSMFVSTIIFKSRHSMATEILAPTERELKNFDLGSTSTVNLIRLAQQADEEDKRLSTWQALKKYKKAVFWSCLLSTALIMEGYDVYVLRLPLLGRAIFDTIAKILEASSSMVSLVKLNCECYDKLISRL